MLKKHRNILALICALWLAVIAGSAAESNNARSVRTVIGRIEQGSFGMIGDMFLIPEDCSGYELQVRPDLPDGYLDEMIPGQAMQEADESSGLVRYPLDEETTRRMLENAYAASISPDGSILWIIYNPSRPFMVVQRGRTFVLMAQSVSRGFPDTDGALKDILEYKLRTSSDPVEGEVRWSPDSRYLFFNDTDRWQGAGMMLNDPYLLDSQTGEIFLIESSGSPKDPVRGTFRCVLNGCFSADGKSFFWYSRSYAPGIAPAHFLMRYDLESGTRETVCELKGTLLDFCEIREKCWFLLEATGNGTNLVRMTLSPDGIERTEQLLPSFCSSGRFFPAVRENVLLAVTPLPNSGTYLLPLTWDTPDSATWYKIGSLRDSGLQAISEDQIETELQEAKRNSSVPDSKNIGTAYIRHAAAIIDVTDLLLTIELRDPIADSWGGGFNHFIGQVLLNTEDLKTYPFLASWVQDGFRDSLINGGCFLAQGYGQYAVYLVSAYSLPETVFLKDELYASPYGKFLCRNESDPLVLTSVTLENRECTADITAVAEDVYTILFRITDYPEPEIQRQEFIVPEILTMDHWTEVTSAMSKKDQKKFSALYTKITPDKLMQRADVDEILACYPTAASETLYVLKSDTKASGLATAESILEAAGYTAEDYRRDMETVSAPRETNISVTKTGQSKTSTVRYTFTASDPLLFPGSTRVQELAGLCEQIGQTVVAGRIGEESPAVESMIQNVYDMGSVDFYVTVDRLETTENTLELSMTVHP